MALSENELKFCAYVSQIYKLYNELPTYELVERNLGISLNEYLRIWNSPKVKKYLKESGIDVDRVLTSTAVLTPLQLLAIDTMLDYNDKRSDARKLKELGINTKTWQSWRSDPAFSNYLKARVEKIVGSDTDEIDRALFDRARSGDISAIKYINEFTGRYRPAVGGVNFDPRVFLIRIQEIILRYVTDPQILENISRDFELLALESTSNYSNTHPSTSSEKVIIGTPDKPILP